VKVQPLKYLHPYLRLQQLYEENSIAPFNAVPLSTSTIPRHVTLDSASLSTLILGFKKAPPNLKDDAVKYALWDEVFQLDNKAFKPKKRPQNQIHRVHKN
jgi:hypothetical protein